MPEVTPPDATPTESVVPVEIVTNATVLPFGGFTDGEVLPTGEIIRGSYDENNNLIGWHKESPAGGTE